jgi:hypothetical protein
MNQHVDNAIYILIRFKLDGQKPIQHIDNI